MGPPSEDGGYPEMLAAAQATELLQWGRRLRTADIVDKDGKPKMGEW